MKIKKLEWVKRDFWIAKSPSMNSGYLSIALEQGKYWPLWSWPPLTGFETLEEAINAAQEFHDAFLSQYLEES